MEKITKIIEGKKLTTKDCEYHTLRALENGGKIRALVIKGDKTLHIEYVCPECKHSGYETQEYKKVSKAARIRFSVKCGKCGFKIKVEKLKGGKKPKKKK